MIAFQQVVFEASCHAILLLYNNILNFVETSTICGLENLKKLATECDQFSIITDFVSADLSCS